MHSQPPSTLPMPRLFDICHKPEESLSWWAETTLNPLLRADADAIRAWKRQFSKECRNEGGTARFSSLNPGSASSFKGAQPTVYGCCCKPPQKPGTDDGRNAC